MEMIELQNKLRDILPTYRFYHTLGVSYTASALAMCHGVEVRKAQLAGLLHDSAKYMTGEEMLRKCEEFEIPINLVERKAPELLHAKLGAYFAKNLYGIEEEEILSAIRCHTTGKPNMSLLEEILYVADYIEPSRRGLPFLEEMREWAFRDLHKATLLELESTLKKVEKRKEALDPLTLETYHFYKNIVEVK